MLCEQESPGVVRATSPHQPCLRLQQWLRRRAHSSSSSSAFVPTEQCKGTCCVLVCGGFSAWWIILEKRTSINIMNSPPDEGEIFPVFVQRNVFIFPGVPWDGKSE